MQVHKCERSKLTHIKDILFNGKERHAAHVHRVSRLADVVTAWGTPWSVIHHHATLHPATRRAHSTSPSVAHKVHVLEAHVVVLKVILIETCIPTTYCESSFIICERLTADIIIIYSL